VASPSWRKSIQPAPHKVEAPRNPAGRKLDLQGVGAGGGQREFIVNNVHPRTLAPITYRYQDPRQFILTNTFSF
jgi:hypothetical protein